MAHGFDEPERFVVKERPREAPGPGEVRVAIRAAAVNFVDLLVATGRYQVRPTLPFTPGGEFAGVVEALGRDVTNFQIGMHVCGSGLDGAFAEAIVTPAAALWPLPDGMDFIEGATFRVGNATAMAALVQGAALQAGETVLVLGAGGSVGHAAIAIARAMGARVIASASSEAKRGLAMAAGAEAAIPADAPDWRDRVKAAAPQGVDVVLDPVGGDATERAFRALAWGGRHLVIGFANGAIPSLPTNLALVKGLRLIGVNIREFHARHPDQGLANMRRLHAMWRTGTLKPMPTTTFPLEHFAPAMRRAAARDHVGRVILDIADS